MVSSIPNTNNFQAVLFDPYMVSISTSSQNGPGSNGNEGVTQSSELQN